MTAAHAGAAPLAFAASAEVGRDEGARIARDELSEPIYDEAEPSLLDIIYTRVTEWFYALAERAGTAFPNGWWVLLLLLAVLAASAAALIVYLRPGRQTRWRGAVIDPGEVLSATDHRAASERRATAGDYAAAVRERLRAITRDLEERAIITPRPGRTATEFAAEASAALPNLRDALHQAAHLFNGIVYGERTATPDSYRLMRELDEQLRASRPVQKAESAG
ncbi:MAG: DUF4129 domain-containing protein [Nocardiopsaceae bacterium]|nr:DUF4129 domain-containing protein [Nocardiopsaceae bacterium]